MKAVALPGLGTGVGQVDPNTCANQVQEGISRIIIGQVRFTKSWSEAQKRHQLLYRDRVTDLQFEE